LIVVVFEMPSFLEVNADGEADHDTIAPSEKEGRKEEIAENHDMTSKDVVHDKADLSKVSKDAVPAESVADTDGKTSPSKSALMK